MTREFFAHLQKEFPAPDYRLWQFSGGFEQFAVSRIGEWKKAPTLETITEIAKSTLKRVNKIHTLPSDIEVIQGLGKGDIMIFPGYTSSGKQHVIGITDLDMKFLRVFFSTSWHIDYGMTLGQIERYSNFTKAYFKEFG